MEEAKSQDLLLEMKNIVKRYPGTLAVNNVDFDVRPGEIHALVGENGAGKSTLMKVIAGSFNDYTGEVFVKGKPVYLSTPNIAKANSIAMIYQELMTANALSVEENIMAGDLPTKRGFVDKKTMRERAMGVLEMMGLEKLDPQLEMSEISQHQAQLIEIGKSLLGKPSILVMDEPTSALSRDEVARLYEIVRSLKASGIGIIYVSHLLSEVMDISDRITVMRDGCVVDTCNTKDITMEQLVDMMVGVKVSDRQEMASAVTGEEMFRTENLSRWGFFHEVSFAVKKGEVLGICGLTGSGRTEIARAIVGLDKLDAGEMFLGGKPVKNRSMKKAMSNGFSYLSENRKSEGLSLRLSMGENIVSAAPEKVSKAGFVSKKLEADLTNELTEKLQVYPPEKKRILYNFSGGNQQKILLGKWLAHDPKVLILDEPTRGVDIGSKLHIHKVVRSIAAQGNAVILISSDLPELASLSDRVIVIRKGRAVAELDKSEISENSLLLAASKSERTDS